MITIEQLRAARALLGLKQSELAQRAGISSSTLNNIERGLQTDPKISTLKAIENALKAEGVTFSEESDGMISILYKPKTKKDSATILVVDDSKSDRLLYRTWLDRYPHKKLKIIDCADAKSGYEAFINNQPDAIILDFMMYGKNGFQLMVQMKEENAKIPPIIFVTSMHSDVISKDALELGVQASLDKKSLTKDRLYQEIQIAIG